MKELHSDVLKWEKDISERYALRYTVLCVNCVSARWCWMLSTGVIYGVSCSSVVWVT